MTSASFSLSPVFGKIAITHLSKQRRVGSAKNEQNSDSNSTLLAKCVIVKVCKIAFFELDVTCFVRDCNFTEDGGQKERNSRLY